jgi:hypothetical protein
MTIKIEKPIVDFRVASSGEQQATTEATTEAANPEAAAFEEMHEKVDRPEYLPGVTYKVKTPLSDHALYITINDILLNPGTDHEQRRPFEIFINSKNMDHFQWVVALTRVISAVFRKGGDCTFMVEELKAVFDPKGGYFKRGGKFMPSLVAEIGEAIEQHLTDIGLLENEEINAHQKAIMEEKRAEFEARNKPAPDEGDNPFPEGAQLCGKCHNKAMIMMDGCLTCLNCGDSKCG